MFLTTKDDLLNLIIEVTEILNVTICLLYAKTTSREKDSKINPYWRSFLLIHVLPVIIEMM